MSAYEENEDRELSLAEAHPILYCEFLKDVGRKHTLKQFALKMRGSHKEFTLYIIHYLEPMLEEKRRYNLILQSKSSILI